MIEHRGDDEPNAIVGVAAVAAVLVATTLCVMFASGFEPGRAAVVLVVAAFVVRRLVREVREAHAKR